MTPTRIILTALGGGAILGSLAAAGIPTTMKPPPAPHWAQLPEPRPVSGASSYRMVDNGPIDLDPYHPTAQYPDRRAPDFGPGYSDSGYSEPRYADRRYAEPDPDFARALPDEYVPLGPHDSRAGPPRGPSDGHALAHAPSAQPAQSRSDIFAPEPDPRAERETAAVAAAAPTRDHAARAAAAAREAARDVRQAERALAEL